MLQNSTPLRKSAPWPLNISDGYVSCTAPAPQNASLQILLKRSTPAIVIATGTNPPRFSQDKVPTCLAARKSTHLQLGKALTCSSSRGWGGGVEWVGAGWVGWGGALGMIMLFGSCTRTVSYTMISSLALAHRHIPTWCFATGSSLELAHRHDATQSDLLLGLGRAGVRWGGCDNVLWLFHTDQRTGCHAMRSLALAHRPRSFLALAHGLAAALSDPFLHLHTDWTPQSEIIPCTCTRAKCHAIRSGSKL